MSTQLFNFSSFHSSHSFFTGATHIVHHYVPGQPFYIREMVYRRVKPLMVEKGVRLNDLGIVSRGNRYFDLPKGAKWGSGDKLAEDAASGKADRTVSPNNSGLGAMAMWVTLCFTFGAASYVVFDQWATLSMMRRIVRKYLYKNKSE